MRAALGAFLGLTVLRGFSAFVFMGRDGATLGGHDDCRLLFVAAITLLIGLVAWLERLGRIALYGAVVLAGGVAGRLLGLSLGTHIAVSGGVVLVSGLFLLVRFLRHNPRLVVSPGDELA